MPLIVMVEHKLLERQAAARGIEIAVQWRRFPRAEAMYDALVSGAIDFASGGVSQLLTTWDRTHTNVEVKGVGALVSMPLYLVTSNPGVKEVADFTAADKIALPEVRTSIQAVTLAMAAQQAFGHGQADRLEPLTVAMGHREAMKALLCDASEIDAHFSAAPLMYEELAQPGIHKVLDSYEVLGGAHTYNAVWASSRFREANPAVFTAFVDALRESHERIRADPAATARLWLNAENVDTIPASEVETIIRAPENEWTMTPKRFMAFANFMYQSGILSTRPTDWQALFFNEIRSLPGS
ncbi:ABC transporter substrate-binding protein [Paraburkholderia unamae]|uniref:ABC transporter substrate-binding protein n=1 Tax=Paraburkholderia unamae TaxID=219649 RepID=UPI001CC3E5BE|nr:ABC transporter substrate-binding protein [Paraburkholderia unamae]